MLIRVLAISLPLALAAIPLHAEIYECVDQSGNKRFTNIKNEANGCKPLNIPPPSAAPKGKSQAKSAPAASPANFPRVDAQTQRDRDADRRRILEQELAREQKLLDQARAALAEQESTRLGSERNYQRVLDRLEPHQKKVKLHEDNVANLQRELANIR
ncbi:MAG: DUF4124 domain-containing protein [Betaproteobacteria bacterium]|nr:DUF4124 domain-containing protein [Betaproteobacteria bacterium]